MTWHELTTERMNVTEARRTWSDLLNRIFRRESHVVVEKGGIPIAAIISMREYELFLEMKARREERFKILDRISEVFENVPTDELERQVARAIAGVRDEKRAREDAPPELMTPEQASTHT
jgi:antitoxin (DNA-binding transcriptional repressor) of toxin-antitoxin stability system